MPIADRHPPCGRTEHWEVTWSHEDTEVLASSICWIWWSGWGLKTTAEFQNILTETEPYLLNVTSMTAQEQLMRRFCQLWGRGKIDKRWGNYRSWNWTVSTHYASSLPNHLASQNHSVRATLLGRRWHFSAQELVYHLGNTSLESPKYLPNAYISA